jgi:hypothetical protein
VSRSLPLFSGDVVEAFVLGVLQGRMESPVIFSVFKERVLWQWGDASLFAELKRALLAMHEKGTVVISGNLNTADTWTIRLA